MVKTWLKVGVCVWLGVGTAWGAGQDSPEYTYVFAHYMTWFETPEANGKWGFWNWESQPHRHDPERILPNGHRDIASIYYPQIGPYSSTDEAVVEYHILLAKAAGIDGFVVNWYGYVNEHGKPRAENAGFRVLLKLAERLQFLVCLDLDDKCMFPPYTHAQDRTAAVNLGREALNRVAREYAPSPAYFKLDQQPVLTNFGWGPPFFSGQKAVSFSPEEWKTMLEVEGRMPYCFIANHQWHWGKSVQEAGFLNVAQSVYPWVAGDEGPRLKFYTESGKAVREKRMKFVSGEACPGFDSWGTWGWGGGRTILERGGGKTYRKTWEESLQAKARWIQLITWNDFAEGTTIEPTEEYGNQYLEMTAEYTKRLGHARVDVSALPLAKAIYAARVGVREAGRESADAAEWGAQLDQAVEAFLAGKYAVCREHVERVTGALRTWAIRRRPPQPAVRVTLSPSQGEVHPEERLELTVTLTNTTGQPFSGSVSLDTGGAWPTGWIRPAFLPVRILPGEPRSYTFTVQVPRGIAAQKVWAEARFLNAEDENLYRSQAAELNVFPLDFHIWVDGPRMLSPGTSSELKVRFQTRQKTSDEGRVALAVPQGWSVSPAYVSVTLPAQGSGEAVFRVTPPQAGSGKLQVVFNSRVQGRQALVQTLLACGPREAGLFRDDLDHDGLDDYVLGNAFVEVHVATGLGGRILALLHRPSGHNQVYLAYPDAGTLETKQAQDWTEFGGINDTFPGIWPGEVWNNVWEARVEADNERVKAVAFSTRSSQGVTLTRRIRLTPSEPGVQVEYDLKNTSEEPKDVIWNSHPDLSPGGGGLAKSTQVIMVPTAGGIVREAFAPTKTKSQYTPSAGWCLALDTLTGEYLAQRFTLVEDLQIGVYKGERFFTVELMPPPFTLPSQAHRQFSVEYRVGCKDWAEVLGVVAP